MVQHAVDAGQPVPGDRLVLVRLEQIKAAKQERDSRLVVALQRVGVSQVAVSPAASPVEVDRSGKSLGGVVQRFGLEIDQAEIVPDGAAARVEVERPLVGPGGLTVAVLPGEEQAQADPR